MITLDDEELMRVTVTLPRVDVDLLDRLGRLEDLNRSAELRGILKQFRPMLRATVEAFEAAVRQRETFDRQVAQASIDELAAAMPELERMQNVYLGAMARLEGAAAASADPDPRPSSHGGHTPTPQDDPSTPEPGTDA